MSLNNIELPDFVLTELYRNSLIAMDTPATPADSRVIAANKQADAAATQIVTASNAVAASPAVTASNTVAPFQYKFLGNNRKNVTIVVQSPGIAFLPDPQLAFLTKMLEACKMNIGDSAIVNYAVHPVEIDALKQQLKPSVVMLFGLQPAAIKLPVDFPPFKIQDYDQCTYLYSPSLDELIMPGEESKLLKSKLWVCLKTLFGV